LAILEEGARVKKIGFGVILIPFYRGNGEGLEGNNALG